MREKVGGVGEMREKVGEVRVKEARGSRGNVGKV